MRPLKIIYVILVLASFITFSSNIAQATPSAQPLYYEFDLGGGLWRYDYTLYNTSDPIADAGFDLFDFFLTFDPTRSLTMITLPTGWEIIAGAGLADIFSANPGPSPIGTDIAPGESLSGFSFAFNYRAGDLPFETLFVNPLGDPASYAGTTAPVPEPSTLLLLGSGVGAITYLRGKKVFKS